MFKRPAPQAGGPTRAAPRRLSWRGLALVCVAMLAFWGAADLAFVTLGAEDDRATSADVIIVLGCVAEGASGPSDCITARANHAAALYSRSLASWIIVSGRPDETAMLARLLQGAAVPPAAIVADDQAADTVQNIRDSKAIMAAHGWRSAILVTEPYHIKRASLIAGDEGMAVYPSPALPSAIWQDPGSRAYHLLRDALSLMLYQVKRVVGMQQ